jgi:hypothetical protein
MMGLGRIRVRLLAGCVMAAGTGGLLAAAAPLAAQQPVVVVQGRGDADNDVFLRQLVRSGEYQLISRDTLITAADTIRGTALVLRATIRLDGVVTGDLVIVDANVFLRPNARVLGTVRNIGGGFYPSELADLQGGVRNEPNAPYLVRRQEQGERLVIVGTVRPATLVRPGFFGFAIPTYDRVDGLTLSYGSGVLLPRLERVEPVLGGRVDYRSQRGAITGGLELEIPRGATALRLGAERTTLTNEAWIREALDNSVAFLFTGRDLRDYYEADRAWVEVRRGLETGERTSSAFVRAQLEEARALGAGSPWTVTGTPREDNIQVDAGRISSVVAGGETEWSQRWHQVRITALVEAAGEVVRGEHGFGRYLVSADWAMAGLASHTLRVIPHFQGPLPGTDSLPRQRWSFVGGSGTLYTYEVARFRGDRVAFVETRYIIPVDGVRLRILGTPDLELLHLAGMAWTADDPRELEQNVGMRIRFPLVNFRAVTNPAAWREELEFSVGANLPRRAWRWERERRERR